MEQINEQLAKEAKSMNSWDDYLEGSATASYNETVKEILKVAELRKNVIPASHYADLDRLVERYCSTLARWTNRYNANRASCPSILITGAGNFPVRKKEMQNAREERLMRVWQSLQELEQKIRSFGCCGFLIKSGDADAVQKLDEKLEKLLRKQEEMKSANAYYRKHNTMKGYKDFTDEYAIKTDEQIKNFYSGEQKPYPTYLLTNNNCKIKQTRDRLEILRREKEDDGFEYDTVGLALEIKENKESMRLQVIFEDKPSSDVRDLLKASAFKWAPSQNAWQRQLTDTARMALRRILKTLQEKEKENETNNG